MAYTHGSNTVHTRYARKGTPMAMNCILWRRRRRGAAAAEVAVEIEVPLLAAVVELHTEAIASGAAAEH